MTPQPASDPAMREAFEAAFQRLPAFMRNEMRIAFTRGWFAAQAHARAEMGEVRRILATAPDLNLKDYSKGQVEKLVRAMQQAYALVSNDPPSLRGDERTALAEPQPTGAGEG